jgi:hypothetical protein
MNWGTWEYRPANLTLIETESGYDVDLEQCNDSAGMLDWIFQVASKPWATPEKIGHLVQALNDLLRPQATICSFGKDRKVPTGAAMRDAIAGRLRFAAAQRQAWAECATSEYKGKLRAVNLGAFMKRTDEILGNA